jgi:hypothetical protein
MEEFQALVTNYFVYSDSGEVDVDSTTGPCLTLEVSKAIIKYASSTLFQHFQLFKYVFTAEQDIEDVSEKRTIELPELIYEPLAEAISSEALAEIELAKRLEKENEDHFDNSLGITH